MKQHILPSQVLEISKANFYSLFPPNSIGHHSNYSTYHNKKVTIGKMLELLKEKFYSIQLQTLREATQPNEKVCLTLWSDPNSDKSLKFWGANEVDTLWEAVKIIL